MIVRSSDASGEIDAGAPEMVELKIGEAEVPVTERGEIWMHYTPAGAGADGAGLEDPVRGSFRPRRWSGSSPAGSS